MKPNKYILPIIVFSQFCGTSLWFSSNAVMQPIIRDFGLEVTALGHLTTAVQLGFITGTLVFALLSVADRYSPSHVFMWSAVLGAIFNLGIIWEQNTLLSLIAFRSITGFFLAGIYPVGMKIASDHYNKDLGKSLGFLVGALVLGTAFPHLLGNMLASISWKQVIALTSLIAILGGFSLLMFVPNGQYRKAGGSISRKQITYVFKNKRFRKAAFGYFGHMWELYTFWALVPLILTTYNSKFPEIRLEVGLYSFIIIGIGALGCVLSGILSEKLGVQKIARYALMLSGCCCLLSPLLFVIPHKAIVLSFLCFWGFFVIADSPLFSTLVAQHAASSIRGTAITLVTCIGFAITIISIQLLTTLQEYGSLSFILPFLAIGPFFGLLSDHRNKTRAS